MGLRLFLALFSFCLLPQGLLAADQAAYGKYLVEEVSKCQDCHTPRLENGQLDKDKWLKGAVLDFQPIHPVPGWHKTSPDITSSGRLFERWGAAGLKKFLTTGLNPRGHAADPPMPAYKLKPADAEAIVEYLKSLK
ncbi:MAG: c-type cytochrome [Bryobacterales bacterium]|nr:c-type cytochrome [Bryobacterales bacterium]